MTEDSGYGPFLTRRGRGKVLTHFIMAVLGAGLAVVLLLAFYSPASGLATAPAGNSSSVKAGEAVVALGNARGQNTISTAAWQVTGLGQTITAGASAAAGTAAVRIGREPGVLR